MIDSLGFLTFFFFNLFCLICQNINLFAEQDKHLSKVNTTTQIVVQVRLMLMKKLNLSDHIT